MDVRVGLWRKLSTEELMLLNCGVGEDSWESFGLQGDPTSPSQRTSVLGVHWKDWRWSWNSNNLASSHEELNHWKRPWCWEGLGAGGEGDNRGWDSWIASPTRWTRVWVNSRSWWWTGRPGVLWFMGWQRVGHNWATELNWTEGCGENGILVRMSNGRATMENKTEIPYDHQYYSWVYIQKNWKQNLKEICTSVLIAALFTLAKRWKWYKYPSMDEWIKNMCYIYTKEYCLPF